MATANEVIERYKLLSPQDQLRVAAELLDQAQAPNCDAGEALVSLRAAATIAQSVGDGLKLGIIAAMRKGLR
jgi:hypothetical protein